MMTDFSWFFREEPCKTDADVLRAVENTCIESGRYPLLHQWQMDVASYPEDVRSRCVKLLLYFFADQKSATVLLCLLDIQIHCPLLSYSFLLALRLPRSPSFSHCDWYFSVGHLQMDLERC